MKPSVFVTGATGYIGSQLALSLARKGHRVSVLVRDPFSSKLPKHRAIKVFQGDILNFDSILQASKGCQYTFHMAAFTDLTCNRIDPYYDNNVRGTANVLEASRVNGIKKFILTSSVSVLGPSKGNIPLTESQPRLVGFDNDYELTKLMSEELVLKYNKDGLPGVILDVSRVYGPGPEGFSNGINRLISLAIKHRLLWVPGRLKQVANYVFIDDVIEAHLLAMEKGMPGEKYIIGGENASYAVLYHTIACSNDNRNQCVELNYNLIKIGLAIKSFFGKFLLGRPGLTPKVLDYIFTDRKVCTTKAESQLGYHITPLKKGIDQTFNYLNN